MRQLPGWFESIKARLSHTDYQHTEFEGADAGTVFANKGQDLRIEAAWFHRDIDDSIEFVQISSQTFAPVNIDSARARGYELETSLQLFARLSLSGAYTYLVTKQRGNGEPLPHRPRNELFGRATLQLGAAGIWRESSYQDEISLTRSERLVVSYDA